MKKLSFLIIGLLVTLLVGCTGNTDEIPRGDDIPERYIVGLEVTENTNHYLSAIPHKKDIKEGRFSETFFSYNTAHPTLIPTFAVNTPFAGYDCGLIETSVSKEGRNFVINQIQETGECDKEQGYYITMFLEHPYTFDTITVNQIINGELQNFYEFTIDPNVPELSPESKY